MFKYLVSVPLRGFRSLIERRFCAFVIAGMAVSVPLRGFRSLIPRYFTRSRDNYFLCFRPLTGIPFLNKVNPGTGTAAFIVVSVPLRGFRSLIHNLESTIEKIARLVSVPLRGFRSLIKGECYL